MVVRRLRRGAYLSVFRVLLGRRGFEHGGEKLFAGNQRGNEERPGQKTERAGSLVRTLRSGFEDLPLLFEQFAFFYFVHDRRLSSIRLKNSARQHSLRVISAHQPAVSFHVSAATSKCPTSKRSAGPIWPMAYSSASSDDIEAS